MTKTEFALATVGLVALGGCSGASIDGRWCQAGQDVSVTLQGGKVMIVEGSTIKTGTYTFDGKTVTPMQDGIEVQAGSFTLTEEGMLTSGDGAFAVTLKRCPS